jgi:pyrimidine-nucleoside phosphorylase
MGAGRLRAEDKIDPAVGIEILAKPGDRVVRGEPLARLHLRNHDPELEQRVANAFAIGPRGPRLAPLVIARVTANSRG